MHETTHQILHLNDQYRLDVNPQDLAPGLRNLLPDAWRKYVGDQKVGVSDQDLMVNDGPKLQQFSSLQISRRPNPHDFPTTLKDYTGWNPEFPESVSMVLKSGEKVIPSDQAKIYKSQRVTEGIKTIPDTPIYVGGLSNIDPSILFTLNQVPDYWNPTEGTIARDEGTLLLTVRDGSGKTYFRWLDIRDFNVVKWLGQNSMEMQVATAGDDPYKFDWKIKYGAPEPSKPPKHEELKHKAFVQMAASDK